MYGTGSSTHATQENSCLPDSAGKTAFAALAIMLTASVALTVAILLPKQPSLNSIFYPVFSVAGGLSFFAFIIALVIMCKPKPSIEVVQPQHIQPQSIPPQLAYQSYQQQPPVIYLSGAPQQGSQRLLTYA